MKSALTPSRVFRVSKGNPWKILPPRFHNRFDISAEEPTATLYVGESAEAALAEVLAPLRPDLSTISLVNSIPAEDEVPTAGVVSQAWLASRTLGAATLKPDTSIVDLSDVETINSLRKIPEIAARARECDFPDVDESSLKASGRNGRRFTQTVAAYIYGEFFSGIRYSSRLGANYHCIAAFIPLGLQSMTDSDFIDEIEQSLPIAANDIFVKEVTRVFQLRVML